MIRETLDPTARKVVCDLLGLDSEQPFSVSQNRESRVFWPDKNDPKENE